MTACMEGSSPQKRAVSFVTMGCAKNEVDTRQMTRRLVQGGYAVIDDPAAADCIVVNTCSFIQSATEESLEAIFDVMGLENVAAGGAKVVVAGCMPARYGDDLEESLPEANSFVPCSREDDILSVVDGLLGVERGEEALGAYRSFGAAADAVPDEYGTFAYVKISDGCDRWCAYCAIPLIRKDFAEPLTLAWLLEALAVQFPDTWFRVLYLEPEGVSDELLRVIAAHENICSYLDIPLQHVNRQVLRSMNRSGDRAAFEALVERTRAAVPDVTLRTTLIAGFPGETEEQFQELLDFAASGDFDYIGVFPFSPEEGTAAFDLPEQLEEDVRVERAQELRDVADAASSAKIAERIGTTCMVLVEGVEEDGQLYGRAMCQAPEVDGCTFLDAGEVGQKRLVTIGDTLFYEMEEG